MKQLLLCMIAIFVLSTHILHAQTISSDISIDTIPNNPAPGSTVTLTATSYSMDLSQADISWIYNNITVAEGVGKSTISVVAPASGGTGVVTVSASGSGTNASSSVILRPGSIDLLWEAVDSYTPPFYKGKALLPVNGLIKYTAIGSATAPKNLSYVWSRNSSALPESSGYGKSSLIIKHNELNPIESVTVTASTGTFSGTGTVRLSPLTTPTAIVYKNQQGYVDYSNGYTKTIPFTQSGMVVHIEPYFFSVPHTILGDLVFDVTVDGQTVNRSIANEIGLSRPTTSGQSSLGVGISTAAQSLQHLQKTFTLLFN